MFDLSHRSVIFLCIPGKSLEKHYAVHELQSSHRRIIQFNCNSAKNNICVITEVLCTSTILYFTIKMLFFISSVFET